MINSLKYVKKLEQAGVSREQAETHIQIASEIMETHFATKQDLKDLDTSLRHEMALLRQDMNTLRQELKQEIVHSEQRMTAKLGTIVSVAIGVAVALTKLVS